MVLYISTIYYNIMVLYIGTIYYIIIALYISTIYYNITVLYIIMSNFKMTLHILVFYEYYCSHFRISKFSKIQKFQNPAIWETLNENYLVKVSRARRSHCRY